MRLNRILRCITPEIKPIIFCSQCKFYNSNKTCKMFNEIDIVTTNITHSFAEICREDKTKCGSKAVFYKKKTEEDFQEEEDTSLWNYLKYPTLIYVIFLFAVKSDF